MGYESWWAIPKFRNTTPNFVWSISKSRGINNDNIEVNFPDGVVNWTD